ncbi:hypothetical protein C1H57_12480 [Clostridium sp. 2-1]|uniref:DUF6751 family protein n=1 Tax=Clostridium TaxID=1485 RepID=UPI000CDA68B9|nr:MULTISPECIES: DUF6751 family protein [Clostridium]MBN7576017.1 hypothetical protein [Clostridium beijerinckii]MBN7581150.1 hypothetical protein [Clostridium beijerinckii]MBN7585738.1 hypothetical protein [Clostridium beijerinckii]MBO0521527.1 hypothetical protein [Clostridium beijerinckii]POO90998.1 hypothetical protein C1H57_12480 [Clostridium sp. 2-1]
MVLFPNTDITIYNKYFDKSSGLDKYQRTVIEGVNWSSKTKLVIGKTVGDKGATVTDVTLIIIDKLDNYIPPKQFKSLPDADRINYFTFGLGDKIVKGNINFEVTKIADLDKNYDDVVTVTAAKLLSRHWEVEAE